MKSYPISLAFLISLIVESQGQTPLIVARTGDAAPGLPGLNYGYTASPTFAAPFLSSTGRVAYLGGVTGPGVTTDVNDVALWQYASGTSSLIARRGDAAPGLPGVTMSTINSFGTQAGNSPVVFSTTLAGSGVTTANDSAIWQGTSPSNLTLVARKGDAVTGLGGALWNTITGNPLLLPDNRHLISGSLVIGTGGVTAANDGIIMIGSTGNLTILVREGDAAPGLAGLSTSNLAISGINANGAASMRAILVGTGVTTSNNTIVMAGTAGAMQTVARTGSQPNGFAAGITYASFSAISPVMQNGNVFFGATVAGTGITTANDLTVWYGSNTSNTQLIFQEGTQVPGQATNTLYGAFGNPRASGNRVAYQSTMTGSAVTTANDQYIGTWTAATGVQVVAREGDSAPGTGGATYGNFLNSSPLPLGLLAPPVLDGENIMFRAALTGSGVNTSNDAGIFLRDASGVRLLVRKGDALDGSTITELTFGDNLFNAPSGNAPISFDGSFTYLATLANGNTVVVFVPVPEPATVLGAVAAVGFVGMRFRRRFASKSSAS